MPTSPANPALDAANAEILALRILLSTVVYLHGGSMQVKEADLALVMKTGRLHSDSVPGGQFLSVRLDGK